MYEFIRLALRMHVDLRNARRNFALEKKLCCALGFSYISDFRNLHISCVYKSQIKLFDFCRLIFFS